MIYIIENNIRGGAGEYPRAEVALAPFVKLGRVHYEFAWGQRYHNMTSNGQQARRWPPLGPKAAGHSNAVCSFVPQELHF